MKFIDSSKNFNNDIGGINGSVFIVDIMPTNNGNVGDKVRNNDSIILDSCSTDTQEITISIIALPGHTRYKPIINIGWNFNLQEIILTEHPDKPVFTGTISINLQNANEIKVTHEDGASHVVYITTDLLPEIFSANFINGYPLTQTELKENDSFDFTLTTDVPIINIEFDDYGAYKYKLINVSPNTHHTVNNLIANRGNTTQSLGAKVRVQKSSGSWSNWFYTEDEGSADGVNLIKLNNQHPVININSINYPINQQALKDNESAIVNNTISHFDIVIYDSPNSQLNINNSSIYETNKSVQRINGEYNISSNNFRITANRAANNATSVLNGIVFIAHAEQIISVSSPERLRSGGNDGTSAQNHTITISSNQRLIEAPSLTAPIGVWQGSSFTWSPSAISFTRLLQIHDNMVKGTYDWGIISTKNLAGKEVSLITNGGTYTLGGFISRIIPLQAFQNETIINTQAINYNKILISWNVKELTNKQPIGTNTPPPIIDGWCLNELDVNPTIIRILDISATDSSSQESYITIQEAI